MSPLQNWFLSMLSMGAPGENLTPILPGGGRILFAGHSFFAPVAETFNKVAEYWSYPNHESIDPVMSGGITGSPINLWNDPVDKFKIIQALQQDPSPEILALTLHNDTIADHYQIWLNEAKLHNPNISLLIGIPFYPDGAITPTLEMAKSVKESYPLLKELVQEVRDNNPDTNIYVIEYTSESIAMKYMYEEGMLEEDVPNGILCSNGCLYRDATPGHPGSMMYDMAALIWLNILYGMDPMSFVPPPGIDFYTEAAVGNITTVAINANQVANWN